MSLVQELLYTISNYPGGYRTIYDIIYNGLPPDGEIIISKKNILSATLSRMKKDGLLKSKNREWSITPEGKELLNGMNSGVRKFFPKQKPLHKITQKNLIVIFDIPEKKKKYREWLRSELIGFGFDMVQKSVWLGPALPKEFVEYLGDIEILKFIRFFRVSEKDLI